MEASLVSNDYNWNDISVGNDTLSCDKFFGFGKKNMQELQPDFIFEETAPDFKENDQNNSNLSELLSPSKLNQENQATHEQSTAKSEAVFKAPLVNRNVRPAKPTLKVPNVILAGEAYEQKRKIRMELLEKKEPEQRQFHSKPKPNFNAIHATQNQKRSMDELKYTIPVTPKVVHHHRKNMEKIKAKMLALEIERQPKPFVSKEADVLHQPAFVPQQSKKTTTVPAPFNFQGVERLQERRQYNEQVRAEKERREKEEEERRRVEDEHIRRELRKATNFKARPNPFA